LDDRPQARAHVRVAPAAAVARSYNPPELGRVYRFPAGTDGTGQTVAILEGCGGFDPADLATYFRGLGIAAPAVRAVGVDGGANQPGKDPKGADGEVALDIEVIGGLAPAAEIVVYFAPNTDAGFLDALSQAAHTTPTRRRSVSAGGRARTSGRPRPAALMARTETAQSCSSKVLTPSARHGSA
jgi:kumamolisin